MTIEGKGSLDTKHRYLDVLPELPKLPSLTPDEQMRLEEWWRRVREAFARMEDAD